MLPNLARLNVAVLGAGPKALASAICLSRHHRVLLGEAGAYRATRRLTGLPMYPGEPELDQLLRRTVRNIEFADSYARALAGADLVIVAEQPVFRAENGRFDMAAVESCLASVARWRPLATVVLETPTPVGYAFRASVQHRLHVIPAPLQLRHGQVAWDRARPRQIVVGDTSERGLTYAFLVVRSCSHPNTPYLLTNPSEAEAIHAFELRRSARGRAESQEHIVEYCHRQRLNVEQVLRGLQPFEFVQESDAVVLLE
ncbi:hypothetical protein F9K07_20885 [Hydrogenophaga sp. BPS33]|nr:hypothetical protein F9K07_20885 [Hydrogenophaga sp. BPS33]